MAQCASVETQGHRNLAFYSEPLPDCRAVEIVAVFQCGYSPFWKSCSYNFFSLMADKPQLLILRQTQKLDLTRHLFVSDRIGTKGTFITIVGYQVPLEGPPQTSLVHETARVRAELALATQLPPLSPAKY